MNTPPVGVRVVKQWVAPAVSLLLLIVAVGCRSIGPSTIPRDRFDYSTSMTESWKRQTLLNIVRLRYLDPPTFVDVGQIVAGYSLETGVDGRGQISASVGADSFANLGAHAVFTDRPTITYTPLTGSRFVRGLMTPIPPEALFYTIQSGWAADAIFEVGVAAVNGLRNEEISIGGYRPPDPKFSRAVELLRKIQTSGAVGMKIMQDKDSNRETKLITFRSRSVTPETLQDITEFRELLGLDPNASEFQLIYGATAATDHEIAVQTRSLLHILSAMSARAEVPPEHVKEGRASPGVDADQAPIGSIPRILCSKDKPKDAFVTVSYRDHWFWVNDRDVRSKRSFSLTLLLFTLADTGEKESLPLITIPAQ
jgi:hypothetical protein